MVSDNNGNPMNSRIKSDEVDIFLPDWTDREFKEIQSSEISDFKLDKTITCGIWCFRGKLLQKCANETLFAVLFGILSSMLTASFTYYSATIATVEKRFSIPNVNTGIIFTGTEVTQVLLAGSISYFAGTRHRPRIIAVGAFCVALCAFLHASPYFIYGAGDNPSTEDRDSKVCQSRTGSCSMVESSFGPQVIMFAAQLSAGVGASLFKTVGPAYLDDNTKQTKTAGMMSKTKHILKRSEEVTF
ncbi:solute carrier organic anion transporter family member 74D isoform X3 [Bemisia tabaci]|uniref:solute carrier organic anion transporter family member 74D isoform X3 n=1 Tax=Bemisia tabaci TaxID=7038 RepID=UPI003B281996